MLSSFGVRGSEISRSLVPSTTNSLLSASFPSISRGPVNSDDVSCAFSVPSLLKRSIRFSAGSATAIFVASALVQIADAARRGGSTETNPKASCPPERKRDTVPSAFKMYTLLSIAIPTEPAKSDVDALIYDCSPPNPPEADDARHICPDDPSSICAAAVNQEVCRARCSRI